MRQMQFSGPVLQNKKRCVERSLLLPTLQCASSLHSSYRIAVGHSRIGYPRWRCGELSFRCRCLYRIRPRPWMHQLCMDFGTSYLFLSPVSHANNWGGIVNKWKLSYDNICSTWIWRPSVELAFPRTRPKLQRQTLATRAPTIGISTLA